MAEWWKAPRFLAGFAFLVGLAYRWLSDRPLWHTDLWGHLAYGRIIWQQGAIPSTEPLMPLSADVPFVDTAWLSQLIGYAAHSASGNAALQCLYAGSIAVCLVLLIWCCYRRTRSAGWTLIGCCLFAWVNWQQLRIIRPQLAGLVCFVSLLVLLTSRRWSRANWLAVPLLFALWANLHGSFPVGLAALGCFCLGRALDVARRTGRLKAVLRDARTRRCLSLTGLAAAAVLLNPYGWGLYAEVWSISANANLDDLVEWQPLTLHMKQGQAAAAAVLALIFVYRMSPRRVSAAEVLLLAGIGGAALWVSRFVLWWAPVAGYCLALHGSAAWKGKRKKEKGKRQEEESASAKSPRSGKWTLVTVGLVLFFFASSPLGLALLRPDQADRRDSLSVQTPVGAVEHLKKHPPCGQVFNTFEWGDYLLWAGPKEIQVFVASHVHLVPRAVWLHYRQILHAAPGWEETLVRYGVNTIVIDRAGHKSLTNRLRQNDDWQIDYADRRSIVFTRKK